MTRAGVVSLVAMGATSAIRAFVPKAAPLIKPIEALPELVETIGSRASRGRVRGAVRAGVRWVDDLDDAIADMVPEVDEHVPEDVRDSFGVVLVWASCLIAGVPYVTPKPKPDNPVKPTAAPPRAFEPAGRGVEVVS